MKISIALPTKNRHHMVLESIEHCLKQSYANIELLIADNSTGEETRGLVALLDDDRIKYHRTGNLSMSENWDFALSQCTGDLAYVIGDKILLKRDAVQTLADFALKNSADAYTFAGNPLASKQTTAQWQRRLTKDLIDSALTGEISLYQESGFHGYSLILSRSILSKIRQRFGRVVLPLSPDYTLAYMASLNMDSFYHLEWCSFEYCYKAASNGFSAGYQGPLFRKFLSDNRMSIEDTIKHVPIKVYTIWNSVLSDFFTVYAANKKIISHDLFDMPRYWKRLYSELVHYSTLTHIDMSEKFAKLYEFMETDPRLQSLDIGHFIEGNRLAISGPIASGRRARPIRRLASKAKHILKRAFGVD